MTKRILVVGGGFSGASATVQLVRASAASLEITIIEPRAEAGRGLAYSTDDPDHRLNGGAAGHSIDPLDPDHFERWCQAERIAERDPAATDPLGLLYARRGDFGRYVGAALRECVERCATGSTIRHLRARALASVPRDGGWSTLTDAGERLPSEAVVIATGNPSPRLPPSLAARLAGHPAVIADPFEVGRLRAIDPASRVLVIGSGLTAVDSISTLVRAGHRGPIVAVSRRGLRPRAHRQTLPGPDEPVRSPFDFIERPMPAFLSSLGPSPTVRSLLRALRGRIAAGAARGESWHQGFDEMRDAVWQLWPSLAAGEKRRFLGSLRAWYDVHRFRLPPQNEAIVRGAEQAGQVRFVAGRLHAADRPAGGDAIRIRWQPRGAATQRCETFDAVINCTGLDAAGGMTGNPYLVSMLASGLMRRDPTGTGFDVDPNCRVIDRAGQASPTLRLVGPPTAGVFGDPLGAIFIAAQIHRMLPDFLTALGATGRRAPFRHDCADTRSKVSGGGGAPSR